MPSRILLLDDSPTYLLTLESILSSAGFETACFGAGPAAVRALTAGPRFDLIITDLNMPVMDGVEFVRAARASAGYRFTPILMLTTESQAARRVEARSAGATGGIVKPVTPPSLLGVIRQVLPS